MILKVNIPFNHQKVIVKKHRGRTECRHKIRIKKNRTGMSEQGRTEQAGKKKAAMEHTC
jgi:hypothetical protein